MSDKFQESLKAMVQSLVDTGYTEEQATELVWKMFNTFGDKV